MARRVGATRFRRGDRVRCERDVPPAGSWPRYDGRSATVVTVNRGDGEVGVTFGNYERAGEVPVDAWFLPWELRHEAE